MTVEFPSAYPTNTATSAGKPVDVQTLQEAFATALRNYGTEKGGTTTNTILEIIRTPHMENAAGDDRNQQRRDQQQHVDQNDFTNIDRKLLDQSEQRNNELSFDYRDRMDRNESLRSDYQSKIERGELPQPTVPINTANQVAPILPPVDIARPNVPTQNNAHSPPQQNVPVHAGANNPTLATNAPNNTANVAPINVFMPGRNTPVSIPSPVTPQTTPAQIVTVFTPLGRFGQPPKKTDDKEDEEESVEETEPKKQQPFAVFEAIQAEAMRPIRQHVSRQSKESIPMPERWQIEEQPREQPKAIEPEQSRSTQTLEEFVNSPAHNVSVQKKGESKQTQHLNRIAAACEAASLYAPIRLKLNLDHLGTLTLRFFHKADKLTLRFETPSKESAQFIHNHLGELRSVLSKRNVKIEHLEILETPESTDI